MAEKKVTPKEPKKAAAATPKTRLQPKQKLNLKKK